MPAIHPAAAGLLAAALLSACSPSAAWTEYSYKEQHFAAAFTAPPKVTKGENSLLVEEADGQVDFGVSAACGLTTEQAPDQVMAAAVEATRRNGTVRNLT
ncbi:MAG: hypothetical protein WDN08_18935 [Rhizomicrobium sp.]